MCTHGKYVVNKYTHERIFVKCGQCHACQMEKASAHYSRVMSHEYAPDRAGYFRLFVTLNYSNQCLPVVYSSDVDKPSIPVYRHIRFSCRRTPKGRFRTYRERGFFQIGTITPNSVDLKRGYNQDLSGLEVPQKWQYGGTCFGVALAKDFSDFLQRLRMNLRRYYKLDTRNVGFSYYKVQEYGPTTRRPHFHVILYFPVSWKKHYYLIRKAIISAWPFCSLEQMRKNIGIAVSGQRYVSQYTCRPSDYPTFFKIRSIAQKSNFSRNFGFGRDEFLPSSILEKIDRRNFTYSYTCMRNGQPSTVVSPVPKYVIDRYFPKFKGQRLLDDKSLSSVLLTPDCLMSRRRLLDLTKEETESIIRRLETSRKLLGLSHYDYMQYYMRVMSSLPLFRMKVDLLSNTSPWDEYYTNNDDAFLFWHENGYLITDALSGEFYSRCYDIYHTHYGDGVESAMSLSDCVNPNNFQQNKINDYEKEVKFEEWKKKAKLNDYAASLEHRFIEFEIKKIDYAEHIEKTVSHCATSS